MDDRKIPVLTMLIPLLHTIIRRHLLRQGIRSQRIRVGETNLHYYETRPDVPVGTILLVHGLGTSASTWTHVLPALAQRYRVLAPDLPGFGFSIPDNGFEPQTIAYYTGVLDQFIRQTVQRPFILLGHSLGGWVTMKYSLANPSMVHHLVLVNTAGVYYHGVEKVRDLFDLRSSRDTRVLLDHIWAQYPWYFRAFTPFVFEDLVRRKVPETVKMVREEDFVNADLGRLTMPVSVVWGLGDNLISGQALRILEEKLPARRVYPIPDCGHVPQVEAAGEFIRILRAILAE